MLAAQLKTLASTKPSKPTLSPWCMCACVSALCLCRQANVFSTQTEEFSCQLPHPGPRPPSSWPPENRPGDSSSSTPPLAWPRGPQPIKPAPQQPQELGSSSPEWGGEGAGASACLGTTRKGRGWSSGWEGLVPAVAFVAAESQSFWKERLDLRPVH